MRKKTFVLFLALALVLGAGIGAVAVTGSTKISALLSYETKVVYNGVEQSFADAKGNPVYPITYNGTTYLPLRAVANMMGENRIAYDGTTKTVTLGAVERQPVKLTTRGNSGGTKYSWVIKDAAELNITGGDATQTFESGIQWSIWNGSYSVGKERLVYCDVAGMSSVTFTAWADIDSEIRVYDQDYKVVTSFKLAKGSMVSKTVDITGLSKIAFGADSQSITDEGTMKILDPTVK